MGDLNCARTPLDIYTTKGKLEAAGFTPQERESFERRILGKRSSSSSSSSSAVATVAGLRDIWRERHPERRAYTYWSFRGRCFPTNNGWRLDYALVHPELAGGARRKRDGCGGGGGGGARDDGGSDFDNGDGDGGGEEEQEAEDDDDSKKSLIHDVFHLPHVRGSDHCPVGVAICAEGHGEEVV